jgi:predicted AlkP superfamily phosphohydrolase/phosphomutase
VVKQSRALIASISDSHARGELVTTTVVVGLDGAGFDLLQPLLDAGELPNLARIIDSGVSGELESVLPPVTSPNWKAYSTGKNPGKLGIFWWYNVDTESGEVYLPADRYHDHDEFWEILGRDERVGVIGMPTTYPPKTVETDGSFVVSGPPDGQNTGFTSPPELESELRDRFDYRVTIPEQFTKESGRAHEEALDLIDTQFRVAKHLLDDRDPEFLQVTTFHINALHHSVWDHEITRRGWRIIDDYLGDFLDAGYNLLLMSDHGHNEIETVFYVNQWLQQEGYLAYDTQVADTLHGLGITSDRLNDLVSTVDRLAPIPNVHEVAERFAPDWLVTNLPDDQGKLGGGKHTNADWDHTEAIGSAQGPIYLTPPASSQRYERLRTEIVEKLESLTTPDGRPVADAVHRGEDVYHGPYVHEGPDILLEQASGIHVSENVGSADVFSDEDDSWLGVNTRRGLFAATGPAFGQGTIDHISILDLAPTILHLHGKSIPSDMDGRARKSVFTEDFRPSRARA